LLLALFLPVSFAPSSHSFIPFSYYLKGSTYDFAHATTPSYWLTATIPYPHLSLQNATISPSNIFFFYYPKGGKNKFLQHIGEKFPIHLVPCPRTLYSSNNNTVKTSKHTNPFYNVNTIDMSTPKHPWYQTDSVHT